MAFVVKVFASGRYTLSPAVGREPDVSLLQKGQQEQFLQFANAWHPLPPQLFQRLQRSLHTRTCAGQLQWWCCCKCCSDSKSWDMDRDPDELLQHIRGQLAGILEPSQYELLEFIGIGQDWDDGRPLLKLWLKDPQRWQA